MISTILAAYLLTVTAIYTGSMAPGESTIRVETHLASEQQCNDAGAKWTRILSYLGATNVNVNCEER